MASVDECDAERSIVFPLEPVVQAHENVVHVDFVHNPKSIDAQVFRVVFDMVVHEGVHEFDQDLRWGLLDDVLGIRFIHDVLEEQHEENENLLEAPGICFQGDAFKELGKSKT